tara:strand:- start:149 stop:355 length:207 start_codon:yes stop_codon:yes gene_type:complete
MVPDPAAPKRYNLTGPESQQTSTESAETLLVGRLASSKIAHNIKGLNVRIDDSPQRSVSTTLLKTVAR